MSPNPQTSCIRIAVQQYARPDGSHGLHMEIPASRFKSLEDISKWLLDFHLPIVCHALILIEIPTAQLEKTWEVKYPQSDHLVSLLREGCIALVNTLVEQSMDPHGNDEVEQLEFVVIRIDERNGTTPGTYIEVAHGNDIASETEWWGDQLPGSIIGYMLIEVYRDTLPLNVRSAIASQYLGELDLLESLVEGSIKSIISPLLSA